MTTSHSSIWARKRALYWATKRQRCEELSRQHWEGTNQQMSREVKWSLNPSNHHSKPRNPLLTVTGCRFSAESLWKLKKWMRTVTARGQILSRIRTVVCEERILAEVVTRKWSDGRRKSMSKSLSQKKLGEKENRKATRIVSLHLAQSLSQGKEVNREATRILNKTETILKDSLLSSSMAVKVDPVPSKVRKADKHI